MTETEKEFQHWLERFVSAFEPLETSLADAWWRLNTRTNPETEAEVARLEEEYRRFLASPERYQDVRRFAKALSEPSTTAVEPNRATLSRQSKVVHDLCTGYQMDHTTISRLVATLVEVESEYNNYRARLGGERVSDNQLKDVLRNSSDSAEVKAAWEASKQIGARVAERILELVGLRNEAAQSLGYDNYQIMSLELHEQDPERLFAILERLAKLTEEPFREVKQEIDAELARKFAISSNEIRPWHYGDPFFQSSPKTGDLDLDKFFKEQSLEELTRKFFRAIGLEVDDVLARSDLYERDGKNQHAFCTHIDRRGEVRVLCNLRSDEYWMSTMLHEFGHAVYDKYLGDSLPYLLREPAHISTTEAIAMLFGRLSRHPEFLVRVAGADASKAENVAKEAREELRRQQLVFVRWALVVVYFERELYRDPQQDLDRLWWDLVSKYQMISPVAGRSAPDWAAKIHVATAPVYYQNYILGELTASQLEDFILERVLGGARSLVGRPEVGEYLIREIFQPGKRYPWDELIVRATGKPLEPEAFLEDYGAAS